MNRKQAIKKIAKKHNLSLILVFGSWATGTVHSNSDLDVAVMAKGDFDYRNHSRLLFDLGEIFPEKEIDLVLINHADPLLLKKILENCKILYGSKRELYELKIYAFKKYCDYQKYFDLEEKFVHKFIKELTP